MEPTQQDTTLPTQPVLPATPNKHFNLLPIIIAGIVMLVLGLGGGYLLFANKNQVKQATTQVSPTTVQQVSPTSSVPTATPTLDPTATWKTYSGKSFSFKYPSEYFISDAQNVLSLALNAKDQLGKPVVIDKIIFTTNPSEFMDYKNFKFCSDPNSQPMPTCVSDDGTYGQKETIGNIALDGKTGISFYMGRGTSNYGYHIVQTTNPSLELRSDMQDKNFDNTFKEILTTFKFTQ